LPNVRAPDTDKVLTESRVVEMWQDCLLRGYKPVTEDGVKLKIIYPGRLNGDRGADFLDAVIDTGNGPVRGDIEVHVRSSGWRAHGHYLDPVYNRVVLHVVYHNDTGVSARLQNGHCIPTLALDKLTPGATGAAGLLPCTGIAGRQGAEIVGDVLDSAGDRRFQDRVDEYYGLIPVTGPEQALYRGIMGALGYAKNKLPFLELAGYVPWHRMGDTVTGIAYDEDFLMRCQALLMGTAGLLPRQRSVPNRVHRYSNKYSEILENIWAHSGGAAAMGDHEWQMVKVRPGNLPVRRMAAMSYLLLRYRRDGLLNGLSAELQVTAKESAGLGLEKALKVNAEGYWAEYLDFGMPVRGPAPALLGGGRAADIIVNVLLPFMAARDRLSSDKNMTEYAIELYRNYPVAAANTLEKHMLKQLGIDRRTVSSARRQQGLLHIYRTLCSQGKCSVCPLGVAGC
jgi:hypothetical protein